MKPCDLSIIIPAYNEGPEFGSRLEQLADHLKHQDYGQVEVLLMMQSDDTSGDREVAKLDTKLFANCRVVDLGKRAGKGGAVRSGIFEATGRYRLFMDADLATPLVHLNEVKALMDHNGEIGICVRSIASTHKGLRKFMSEFGNILVQIVLLPGIKDSQCGFKVFRADVAEELFGRQRILGWAFDMEILAIGRKLGYRIQTFPADDWKDPKTAGLVGDSALKSAINMFKDMLKIRWNFILGRYRKRSFTYTPQRNL